ncbi:MAG: hypothetical protein IT303_20210 [Dehalococcoidia bacterium]|nr:hypothetical protein [Dehalococcoidia bacterium]
MLEQTTARHELHQLVDALDDEQAQDVLDYLNNLGDDDEATPEEIAAHETGLAQIAAGDSVSLEELERELGLDGDRELDGTPWPPAKPELHRIIDLFDEPLAAEVLTHLRAFLSPVRLNHDDVERMAARLRAFALRLRAGNGDPART